MDIRKLAEEGRTEEIERQLMDLNGEFRFKCRKCGKCCKHQNTILFNSRDIFNIARKFQMTPEEVINEYAETYIGSASKIPVVHMVPRGKNEVCPFLKGGLCSIHDCKPTVCASFPLGRVVVNAETIKKGLESGPVEVKYMLVDTDCGSRKRVNTVREWLARFGIPEHDELFLMWSRLTAMLHRMICELEEHHMSGETLNLFWNAIYYTLYLDYDTSAEFLPQFRQAAEKLTSLCQGVAEVGKILPSSGTTYEEA